jgi:putative acetyltransferase
VSVRRATDDDWPTIREVHRRAFGDEGDDVVRLVDELRADPELFVADLSFVSMSGDRVAGHVMNSWVDVAGTPALQLSPLGVLPEHQRQGHGSALVRASLAAVAEREPFVLVEGNPAYYGRFGFVRADELGLRPPPEALYDWVFQVAVLDESVPLPQGQAHYSAPFRH